MTVQVVRVVSLGTTMHSPWNHVRLIVRMDGYLKRSDRIDSLHQLEPNGLELSDGERVHPSQLSRNFALYPRLTPLP